MTHDELLSLCHSKGLSEIPDDIAVYDDGFIFLQPIKIKGHDADYLIVGCVNDRYSIALFKGVVKKIRGRKRLLVSNIHDNFDEMFAAVKRTGGEVLPDNNCFWRV